MDTIVLQVVLRVLDVHEANTLPSQEQLHVVIVPQASTSIGLEDRIAVHAGLDDMVQRLDKLLVVHVQSAQVGNQPIPSVHKQLVRLVVQVIMLLVVGTNANRVD